uniref:O-phospho-L-seryl-tRNA(Sec):L-selenocysteinyl-tRNA synthase n=1 Tax=Caenorhabditis tropicalis TaxID=1561998 RepID=A0A1I7TKM1_9PELO
MMIIEERSNEDLNLESIDNDLRMEKIHQNAEKVGWEHFSKSVRRNLLEKRHTLESRVRLDVLSSLAFIKEHLPIEKDTNVFRKIQQLADGLGDHCVVTAHSNGCYIKHPDVTIDIGIAEDNISSCKIGYFGQPLFDAPDALNLLKTGEFSKLRDAVSLILSSLPKEISM